MSCPRPWLAVMLLACSFDASGQGEVPLSSAGSSTTGDGSSVGPGSTTLTTGVVPDTSTSTAGVTGTGTSTSTGSIEPDTTTGPDTTTTTTTDASTTSTTEPDTTTGTTTSTTGPPSCDGMFVKQIELVADATVQPPMVAAMSMQNEGLVAYSPETDKGTVTFTFDIGCSGGDFSVWGRVLDAEPGTNSNDPDSFHVRADGGQEIGWFYGCQTAQLNDGYHWLRVHSGIPNQDCDTIVPWTVQFAPGMHTITLRNREPIDGLGNVAAVARILVTNDPNYVPKPPD